MIPEPRLPREHPQVPRHRLPPQEADRRRRAVRRREADHRPGAARRRLRLRRDGQGRRRSAQLHPRRRGRRPDAMERGPLGFPVVDVAVTLTDGLAHAVDSSDMAFRIAGRRGVAEALEAAGAGAAAADLQGRDPRAVGVHRRPRRRSSPRTHGQVLGFAPDPDAKGWEIFEALVPGGRPAGPRQRRARRDPRRRLVRARPSTTTRSCTARPPTGSCRSARANPPDARQAGSSSATSSTSPGGSRAIDPSRTIRVSMAPSLPRR